MVAAVVLTALTAFGCSGAESSRGAPSTPAERAVAAQRAADSRDSTILGHVPAGTFGPHLVVEKGRRLVAWAIGSGARQGFYALSLPSDRAPGAAQRFGDVLPGLELMRVRPDGTVGFVIVTSRAAGQNYVIEGYSLGADGMLRSGPRVLAETPSRVTWLDAVPTARGALVVWAEKNGEQADVYAVPFGLLGPEGAPKRQVRAALAWQVARFGGGAALATVEAAGKGRDVVVRFIGDDGQRAAPDIKVAEGVHAELDLDFSVAKDKTLLAFSESVGFERRLMLAELDQSGALRHAAQPATLPRGDQSLYALVASPESPDAFVVWQEARKASTVGRRLELARVDENGALSKGSELSLEVGDDPVLPSFVKTPTGLAVAARTLVCEPGQSAEQCRKSPEVPAVVHLDRDLGRTSTTRVQLEPLDKAAPDLVWDLGIEGGSLWALAARAEDPAPVFLERLALPSAGVKSVKRPAALPQVRLDRGVLEVPDLVDFDVWPKADGTVVTWLSYFDPNTPYVKPTTPAPDGKREPVRAILRSETLLGEADERAVGLPTKVPEAETTISWRAHSLGGLASATAENGLRLLVWSALDAGQPEVFLTLVDQAGKKVKQRMLTHAPGDVSDVAAVRVPDGWVVAWVDGRGDKTEVYAVRLDERIETVGQERALTAGSVNPTGVQLLTRGDRVLAAWSDARGASRRGYADIYLATLSTKDASTLSGPIKLASTELHSYVPVLTARGQGAALAFIEGEPDVESSEASSVFVAELDADGRALAAPTRLALNGRPTSLALACQDVCMLAATLDVGRRSELWGVSFDQGAFGVPELLSVLTLPPDEAVAPVFAGGALYYVDAFGDERVLRRLVADWR